jgi:hypothetical protein
MRGQRPVAYFYYDAAEGAASEMPLLSEYDVLLARNDDTGWLGLRRFPDDGNDWAEFAQCVTKANVAAENGLVVGPAFCTVEIDAMIYGTRDETMLHALCAERT